MLSRNHMHPMSELVKGKWRVMVHGGNDPYMYSIDGDCSCCGTTVRIIDGYFGKEESKREFIKNHFHHIVRCVNSGGVPPTYSRVSSVGLTKAKRDIATLEESNKVLTERNAKLSGEVRVYMEALQVERDRKSSRRCTKGHVSHSKGDNCTCGAPWKTE